MTALADGLERESAPEHGREHPIERAVWEHLVVFGRDTHERVEKLLGVGFELLRVGRLELDLHDVLELVLGEDELRLGGQRGLGRVWL